jgi:DNA-binding response OmpR family regulator
MKVLVVEDEPKVAHFIKQGLEENELEVQLVFDGKMGLQVATNNHFDIILLDVIIPYINGVELCKMIKEKKPETPVLMLTALGTMDDKITGFDAGADDYLVKPFEFKELMARIRALTRRGSYLPKPSNKLTIADLELDLDKKCAVRAGRNIDLTAKEFSLLEYLIKNKGRVVSRVDIAEKVWEITFDTGTNVIDVYVNILRKKIDKDADQKLIQTRVGHGYMINE